MSLAWSAFILVALVAMGNFADFLIGTKGQRKLKDRLIALYLVLSESEWSGIAQLVAKATTGYVDKLFGPRLFSARAILIVGLLSASVSSAILTAALSLEYKSVGKALHILVDTRFARAAAAILIANFVLDILSLASARWLLKRATVSRSKLRTLGLLCSIGAMGYVAVAVAMLFTVPTSIVGLALGDSTLSDLAVLWSTMLRVKLQGALTSPWEAGMAIGGVDFSIFSIAAAFGVWLHLLILSSAYALWLSQPVTRRPLLLLVERLEEAPNGLFTTLGVAVAAIAGLIGAYQKVMT